MECYVTSVIGVFEMIKRVPATIIIDGVEMTVIDAVTKKQLVRIINDEV